MFSRYLLGLNSSAQTDLSSSVSTGVIGRPLKPLVFSGAIGLDGTVKNQDGMVHSFAVIPVWLRWVVVVHGPQKVRVIV